METPPEILTVWHCNLLTYLQKETMQRTTTSCKTRRSVAARLAMIATWFYVGGLGKGQGFEERIARHRKILKGTKVDSADLAAIDCLLTHVGDSVRFFQFQS